MKNIDILKDLLQYKVKNQIAYNETMIDIRNPEVRQIFTQLRDDEFRDVVKLQQKIERTQTSPAIISKLIPTKPRY